MFCIVLALLVLCCFVLFAFVVLRYGFVLLCCGLSLNGLACLVEV